MKRFAAWAGLILAAQMACGGEYRLNMSGTVSLGDGLELRVTAYPKDWNGVSPSGIGFNAPSRETGTVRWQLKAGTHAYGDGETTLLALADGRAYVRVAVKMLEDFPSEGLVCTLSVPADLFVGGSFEDDRGEKGTIPAQRDKLFVYSGRPNRFAFDIPGLKRRLAIGFTGWTYFMLQDDRAWCKTFTLRMYLRSGGALLKANETYETTICLGGEGATVAYAEPYTITSGPDWLPLDYKKDIVPGSAADFSHLPLRDAPAGKHGWLKNGNGHFVFERKPDAPQRFWGANFCGEGTCPTHADADRIVRRFEQAGYNTMRIHHYENTLLKDSPDRMTFNPEMLDRFDYFFAKAKEHGIYVTTDLFVSRRIDWRDIGIDQEGPVEMSLAKGLFLVHEPAYRNWQTFARNLLLHVNPYTGLKYADDPALPYISLVNEGVFAWKRGIFDQDATRAVWRKWLAEKRAANPAYGPNAPADCLGHSVDDAKKNGGAELFDFMSEMEARFAVRARDWLRSIGVKAMLTDWNCGQYPAAGAITNNLDYVDMHFYVDHPSFLGARWQLPVRMGNSRPDQAAGMLSVWAGRIAHDAKMPYTVSEWNFTAPNARRGAAGLMTGATAARLDWDVLWRFDYLGRGSDLDDGATSLSYFSISADPFQTASDRAGVLLFLRRELEPQAADAPYRFPLPIEPKTGRFTVCSAATAGGYGLAGDTVKAGPFACRLGGTDASVWASATDLKPLVASDRILVTHLTDLKADGATFMDDTCRVLQRMGSKNLIVRRGTAEVSLALKEPSAYDVWALETNGARSEKLPIRIVDDRLVFTADVKNPAGKARFLYEVVRRTCP